MAKKAKTVEAGEGGRKTPERSVFVVFDGDGAAIAVTSKAERVFELQEENAGATAKKFIING